MVKAYRHSELNATENKMIKLIVLREAKDSES